MSKEMITSKTKLMLINQAVFSGKIGYALEISSSKSLLIQDNKLIGRKLSGSVCRHFYSLVKFLQFSDN